MRVWLAAGIVTSVACGRLGFDTIGGSPEDALGTHPDVIYTANVVFVTTPQYVAGALGGFAGGDAACAAEARAAGLPGTYRAWIGTAAINPKDHLNGARGWVRTDGLPFADTADDVASGKILTPVALLADGTSQLRTVPTSVMTGAALDGTTDVTENCSDWTTTGFAASGDLGVTSSEAIRNGGVDCSMASRLYCFGIDATAPLVLPAATPGRRAFRSTAWLSGNGLADADAHCQADAASISLAGTFKALLATATASAASRFNANGPPWVRLDGIAIAPTAAEVLMVGPTIPLNLRIDGSYDYDEAFTGAATPSALGNQTCTDWTVGNPSRSATAGRPEYTLEGFFSVNVQRCDSPSALYCLEP